MNCFVKICGITNLEDALVAVEFGADALGFNFYPKSPRFLTVETAEKILQDIPPAVARVGVFVNEKESFVVDICQRLRLDILQFHGDELPVYCEQFATPYWKAFPLRDKKTLELMKKYHPEAYLVDAFSAELRGGTGQTANWELARQAKSVGRIILAGGLNPDNVQAAIEAVQPWGVDACSGLESAPGKKDRAKLEAFLQKVKNEITSG